MQLLSVLSMLATVGIAAATPAPLPEPEDKTLLAPRYSTLPTWWAVTGWANPDCQGEMLWSYAGDSDYCLDFPAEAASVTTYEQQTTQYAWHDIPLCTRVKGRGDGAGGAAAVPGEGRNVTSVTVVHGPALADGSMQSSSRRRRYIPSSRECQNWPTIQGGLWNVFITLM